MKYLKNRKILLSSIIFVLVVVLAFPILGRAENVVILSESNPDLTLAKIQSPDDPMLPTGWPNIDGSLTQNEGKYTLTSNGYTQWYKDDSLCFAYKKVYFNYGREAVLTAETQLDSWDAVVSVAAAGIMIRSSLAPGAATVLMQTRPSELMYTYRSADGISTDNAGTVAVPIEYPVKLKIVLNKNKVECYYQQASDSKYLKCGAATFTYGPSVYIGLGCYSCEENVLRTAKYTGFSYQVEAPLGTEVNPDEGEDPSDTPSEDTSSEETVVLPEDSPVESDVILSETFTDGSMFDGNKSVTNPIWKTNNVASPEILLNEEQTNRFLSEYMTNSYYKAGDETWTDYETSLDLVFTDDYSSAEANRVDIYTRLTSVAQYGYHSYVVRFIDGNSIQIGYIEGVDEPMANKGMTIVDSASYDYAHKLETTLHLTIRTFDNEVSLYIREGDSQENKKILSFKDETDEIKSTGCIGFSSFEAGIEVDNFKVVKLQDLLGGDYDNRISSRWDQPIPVYIQEHINAGFEY